MARGGMLILRSLIVVHTGQEEGLCGKCVDGGAQRTLGYDMDLIHTLNVASISTYVQIKGLGMNLSITDEFMRQKDFSMGI
jgi:hypothetical protein